MDTELLLIAAGFPVMFIAGVVFHRYVVSEAEKIKAHVSAEIQEVRADLAETVKRAAGKL